VFTKRPRWAGKDFWAPEITRLSDGRFAVFFSAQSKNPKLWHCLGVARARAPEGPWRDLGRPLRCGRYGSIDAYPTRDENGRLYLIWKEDGNAFQRPTPMFAQRLQEDGARLLGRPKELFRNNPRSWERKVVEAADVTRHGGYFYLLYSGGLCCTRKCAYAVGVARSKRLLGPWRKYAGNPILRGGNGWRCPGHTTVVGGDTALFHAYRAGAGRIAGRQLLAAPFTYGPNGWPRIGDGRPPAPAIGAASTAFTDNFASLAPEWEYSNRRPPGIRIGNGLTLRAHRANKRRLDGGVLARRTGTVNYTATATIDGASLGGSQHLDGGTHAGIASYRSGFEAIGVAVGPRRAVVWQRRKGRYRERSVVLLPGNMLEHVRMVARGNRFLFQVSPNGVTWRGVGRGYLRGPIEESARFALTVGGERRASARFISASLEE
jgi:beta-xylosidase